MKIRLPNLFRIVVLLLILIGILYAALPPRTDTAAQRALADTRLALRQQGFKTDLADFDFSTSPEMRTRETLLKATAPDNRSEPFGDYPNLMEIVGDNSAIVVWQQPALKNPYPSSPDNSGEMSWDDFRDALNDNQPQVDAACAAILSGPIQFSLNASAGGAMLLPHLSILKNLTQSLGSRMVLALHDGNQNAAFTNLLAATRLVTAWNVEPAEVSHLVGFADTKLVFDATWQLLQTNHWPDEKLARLQTEWQSVNFFTNLPEVVAFTRASRIAAYAHDRNEVMRPPMPFNEFLHETWPNPLNIWGEYRRRWLQREYLHGGMYEDEKDVLLFYRAREVEQRNAVQAPTWMQMRQLPGVTNEIFFQSKYSSRAQMMMNLQRTSMAFERQGSSFLGRAAEAEAERRILITAIALERHREKYGSCPKTLADLTPEFLQSPLPDFMDGQPLRYRLTDDSHFLLYSAGQDCEDNGGKILNPEDRMAALREFRSTGIAPEADIVWPLPADMAEINAVQQREQTVRENRADEMEEMQANAEWDFTSKRQAEVGKLLAQSAKFVSPDTMYHGRPLTEILQNVNSAGTNHLSLAELLTPHQIITGAEPETVTFDIPIAYDVLTNVGSLDLYVDPATDTDSDVGAYALQCDSSRATNGDCLLAWSTIYECPGKHALTVGLTLNDLPPDKQDFGGFMLPFDVTNLCQFSLSSAHFDPETGATWRARLPEKNASYIVECNTTNGAHLKTLAGTTTDGVIKLHWDLVDDHGQRFTNDFFNSVFHITLPDSGRSQTLRGP